jgi:hypothetical protein
MSPDKGYGRPDLMRAWDAHTGRIVPDLDNARLMPGRLGAAVVHGQPVVAVASHARLSVIDGHTGNAVCPDFYTEAQVIALAVADVDGRAAVGCRSGRWRR